MTPVDDFRTSVESLVDELGEGGCPGAFQTVTAFLPCSARMNPLPGRDKVTYRYHPTRLPCLRRWEQQPRHHRLPNPSQAESNLRLPSRLSAPDDIPAGQFVYSSIAGTTKRDFTGKMTQMIGNASLEIRLILNSPGKTRAMGSQGPEHAVGFLCGASGPIVFSNCPDLERYPLKVSCRSDSAES
ncbi:MAG: hypothetical protein Ct9H90mP9_4560 [Pseudomonadota bacterium]|nr:MAG: hypothetical protein Ct9H90mP9_4560 [Pseudomonadota bacterium]